MNKIITTSVADPSIAQPFTAKSLDFLQSANKETVLALAQALVGDSYDSTKAYVLKGLDAYGTNQYNEGYVLWGGEVYYSVGKSTTTAFVNVAVMTITVTNDATADPVTFTDNISRNVHNVRRLVLSDAVTGTGTFDLSVAVYINRFVNGTAPTFTAYTTADVLVGGGVTVVGTPTYMYILSQNVMKVWFRTTNISTTATTAKITITLPIAMPAPSGVSSAFGTGVCMFYKSGTGGVPCLVWINLNSSGAGTDLTIEKQDGTAFGVLNAYEASFSLDIYLQY